MKEFEFLKALTKLGFENGIKQNIYYILDDTKKHNVILDIEEIKTQFDSQLKEIEDLK